MTCDECKNLIGAFMENELVGPTADLMRHHLAHCGPCAETCHDLASLIDVCANEPASGLVPPNSQAMWCRINNIIETEIKPELIPPPVEKKPRFLWQFSFIQLTAALGCIAVISSLLTVVAIKNYSEIPGDFTTRSAATQTTLEKVMTRVGLMDSPAQARHKRLQEQHAAIKYWDERVTLRRAQWDRTTRDAFDRNLQVIDESVSEYTMILQRDPEDELSGEMLDSVLNEKMNLLRDFADL